MAAGLDQISAQDGGSSIVLEALKGFLLSEHARPKIIELLTQRVVRDISHVSSEEMCEFVALTRNLEDEVASMGGNAEINYTTQVEAILTTIEPYVVEELSLLTVTDLMNAYIGFTHTHVSKPFEITNALESKLIKLSITKKMNFDDASEVLFEFSKQSIGSKILIETLAYMIETESAEKYALLKAANYKQDEPMNKHTGYKAIVALDTIQSKDSLRAIYQIGKMMDKNMDYEQLYTLKTIFAKNG